jgi:hypothetical protein
MAVKLEPILHEIPDSIINENTGTSLMCDRSVVLTKSYRSVPEIQSIAEDIKNKKAVLSISILDPGGILPDRGVWKFAIGREQKLFWRLIEAFIDNNGSSARDYRTLVAETSLINPDEISDNDKKTLKEILNHINSFRVLCPMRSGPFGTESINGFLSDKMSRILDDSPGQRHFTGMPVMITKNDYARGLFNGDIGVILKFSGTYYGVFMRDQDFICYQTDNLPLSETSYAITIHKSQGSEYDRILISMPPTRSGRLCSREMLYTAVTRARSLLIIASDDATLEYAVTNGVLRTSNLHNII